MENQNFIWTRRLATANASHIGILVNTFLATAGGVVDPVKTFLLSSLLTMQNLVVNTVGAYVDPKSIHPNIQRHAPYPLDKGHSSN